MHEYKVEILGQIVTVESETDMTQSQIRQLAIEKLNNMGEVEVKSARVFKCTARFSGCSYYVEGVYPNDAAGNLEDFLRLQRERALEELPVGTPAYDLLADMSTAAEVGDEVDKEAEISMEGRQTKFY